MNERSQISLRHSQPYFYKDRNLNVLNFYVFRILLYWCNEMYTVETSTGLVGVVCIVSEGLQRYRLFVTRYRVWLGIQRITGVISIGCIGGKIFVTSLPYDTLRPLSSYRPPWLVWTQVEVDTWNDRLTHPSPSCWDREIWEQKVLQFRCQCWSVIITLLICRLHFTYEYRQELELTCNLRRPFTNFYGYKSGTGSG